MTTPPLPLIRPEARAALWRWREVGAALAIIALGGMIASRGGYILLPFGGLMALAGLSLGLLALRRMRFARTGADTREAPGLVQVDEGQVSYMGPQIGGYIDLPELAELRIISIRGRRLWRLKQLDGQAILIPMQAAGAEELFDAFAALPGLSSADLIAALAPPPGTDSRAVQAGGENRLIWRRQGSGVAPR